MQKARRNSAVIKNKALWAYSRYEVIRMVWKGVMVPGLTFGNAVLCTNAGILSFMETRQRGVGRLALGAHGNTPNEGVMGDMGWSSFEGREAKSKIEYEARLRKLDEKMWARKVLSYLFLKNIDTKWRKRTRRLASKYLHWEEGNSKKSIKSRVKDAETEHWTSKMQEKSSLALYREHKSEIRREGIFDNSIGSALLFEARTGMLRTKLI